MVAAAETAPAVIRLSHVSKSYGLRSTSGGRQLLRRLIHGGETATHRNVLALDGINLIVHRNERLGIVGRNGAGKTTLLKLITGNFRPNSGEVAVNGNVQALMSVGEGFHPEFTGRENVNAALSYAGVIGERHTAAAADVIEFAELGAFIDQPVKTYSTGMCSRLQFAVASAVRPELLIVDEILGAGDAYFAAKCARRMAALAVSGVTLLLVSHSSNQILQFCEDAIWLEEGRLVMRGAALQVVKAYEEFITLIQNRRLSEDHGEIGGIGRPDAPAAAERRTILASVLERYASASRLASRTTVTTGGVSRWTGTTKGLHVEDVRFVDQSGQEISTAYRGDALTIEIEVMADIDGIYPCAFAVVIRDEQGLWLMRHCSGYAHYSVRPGERRTGRLHFDALQLGAGRYNVSVGIYRFLDLADLSTVDYYEIVSRSWEFSVIDPAHRSPALFDQRGEWNLPSLSVTPLAK